MSTDVLLQSTCEVLLSEAFSGYKKSINAANEIRASQGLPPLVAAYCNTHARRQFYRLNEESRGLSDEGVLEKRAAMMPHFEAIHSETRTKVDGYPSKSTMGTAYNYFLDYYEGLTRFITNNKIPIDNNPVERLLRSRSQPRRRPQNVVWDSFKSGS